MSDRPILLSLYLLKLILDTAFFFFHSHRTELSLGALAGAIAQVFTIPVSVVATRQQLDNSKTGGKSLLITAGEIIREDGPTGLWRGLKPSLVLTVNPAITYGTFERLKLIILGPDGTMTPGKAFWMGALSKTLATIVTYPYIMAKVRLQAKYDTSSNSDEESLADKTQSSETSKKRHSKERYNGAIDVLRQVYAEKGCLGWYQVCSNSQFISLILLHLEKKKNEYR